VMVGVRGIRVINTQAKFSHKKKLKQTKKKLPWRDWAEKPIKRGTIKGRRKNEEKTIRSNGTTYKD